MTDRRCDSPTCSNRLDGVKAHGWPSKDGRSILCTSCGNPEPKRKARRK